jgi:hypothetical protein
MIYEYNTRSISQLYKTFKNLCKTYTLTYTIKEYIFEMTAKICHDIVAVDSKSKTYLI